MSQATATSPLMPTYPPPPVTFVRGEGSYLWDDEGRRYLDLLSGLAVTALGHAHPAVAEAFLAARMAGGWGGAFGTLPTGLDLAPIIERAMRRATTKDLARLKALLETDQRPD